MSKKAALKFDAPTFRILLSVALLVSTGIGVAGFYYIQKSLKTYAIEVSHKRIDADASDSNISDLQATEKNLTDSRRILEKLGLLRATSDFPVIRAISEIEGIARKNDISATYATDDAAATGGATTPPTTGQPVVPATPATSKTAVIVATPTEPVSYQQALQFIYDIEQHIPKMKVDGISITPGGGEAGTNGESAPLNPNQVSVGVLRIHLYIT